MLRGRRRRRRLQWGPGAGRCRCISASRRLTQRAKLGWKPPGEGGTERARRRGKGAGSGRGRSRAGGGGGPPGVCHSRAPSESGGCAERGAGRRRGPRSRTRRGPRSRSRRRLAARAAARRLSSLRGSTSRVPPGHGRAPRPRAPRLLSLAGGGAEAGRPARPARSGGERPRSRAGARAPRPVPAARARVARSPDEP